MSGGESCLPDLSSAEGGRGEATLRGTLNSSESILGLRLEGVMEDYRFPAVETVYRDVVFRSRLEARWAAMFDLMGWRWQYEPVELDGWFPDFFVGYPCWHSECLNGQQFRLHWFLAEVKPYHSVDQFAGHRANHYQWCREGWGGESCFWDGVMFCGVSHETCYWEGSHGSGGGINNLHDFGDFSRQWQQAGVMTQWKR